MSSYGSPSIAHTLTFRLWCFVWQRESAESHVFSSIIPPAPKQTAGDGFVLSRNVRSHLYTKNKAILCTVELVSTERLICTVDFRNRNVSLLNVSCLIFWLTILEKMASGHLLCLTLILYVCVRVCLHLLSPYHTHTHTHTHTHSTKTDLSDDSYSSKCQMCCVFVTLTTVLCVSHLDYL